MLTERILLGSTLIVPIVAGLIAPSFLRGLGFVVIWAAATQWLLQAPLEKFLATPGYGAIIVTIVFGIRSFIKWLFRAKTSQVASPSPAPPQSTALPDDQRSSH